MEQINRVEIRGTVGFVRINDFDGNPMATFSVVTNYVYKGRDGSGVVETMWFNVSAWKRPQSLQDFSKLQKGTVVHVLGRMREREYTSSDGTMKRISEVIANKVSIVETEENLTPCHAE